MLRVVEVAAAGGLQDERDAVRGRVGEQLGILMFMVYLIPPTLLFIPMTGIIADLGLQNNMFSMVLVYPTFTIPFCTWLLMGYFRTIPYELEECALIDGATRLKAVLQIVLPLTLPGIAATLGFVFTAAWSELTS